MDQNERLFTEVLCRREFGTLFIVHCFIIATGSLIIHVFAYLFPNDYHLTFNCYWIFLPPDGFLFAWKVHDFRDVLQCALLHVLRTFATFVDEPNLLAA